VNEKEEEERERKKYLMRRKLNDRGNEKKTIKCLDRKKKRQMREIGSEKEREIARERTKW